MELAILIQQTGFRFLGQTWMLNSYPSSIGTYSEICGSFYLKVQKTESICFYGSHSSGLNTTDFPNISFFHVDIIEIVTQIKN